MGKNYIANHISAYVKGENRIYNISFLLIAVISLFTLLGMSRTSAISGDEFRYISQSAKVYKYFETGGENKAAITQKGIDPQHFNSQSFDVIVYYLEKKLNIEDTFLFRHRVNTLTGWLAILFAALIAIDIFGIKAGILTFLLLLASPRFIGHSFNNHRDIPLALSFTFTIYALLLFLKQYGQSPKKNIKNMALLAIGIASAYSLRLAGGILLSAFTAFFMVVYTLEEKDYKKLLSSHVLSKLFKISGISLIVLIIGFYLGILIWPFGLEGPIKNSLEVFRASSSLGVSLNQLFEGRLIQSNTIPWYYTPKFMIITIPLVVIFGFALYFIMQLISKFKRFDKREFIILGVAILPIIYTVLSTQNDYGGWRHFIFVYPFIVIIAARAFTLIMAYFKSSIVSIATLIGIAVLLALPSSFIIRNHPYQYVYFNEFVGGVSKAYTVYESDYSCNGVLGGSNWIEENIIPKLKEGEKITIASNFDGALKSYMEPYKDNVKVIYTRYYSRAQKDWDYAVYYCGYISPEQLTNGMWPPKGTIYTEMVDNFPIAAVVKRPSHDDYKGFQALKNNNTQQALQHFQACLKVHPENTEVLSSMSQIMLSSGNLIAAKQYADKALKYDSRQITALLYKAIASNNLGQYEEAIDACEKLEGVRKGVSQAYYQKGIAYKNLNKPNEAFKEFQMALGYNPKDFQSYMQMADIFINYKNYQNAINIYDKMAQQGGRSITSIVNTAKCYHLLGDNIKANNVLNPLMKQYADNPEVIKVRARIAISDNDIPNASVLLNSINSNINDPEIHIIKALLSIKQGQNENAKVALKTAIKVAPTNREAQELFNGLK